MTREILLYVFEERIKFKFEHDVRMFQSASISTIRHVAGESFVNLDRKYGH